ncbi:hypothetical protein ACLB2K_007223 [Fragaria x ananassa]
MPWNSLMDRMMKEFHSQGKTIEDIVEVLKTTTIHPRIVAAIKAAHALGCDLRISVITEGIRALIEGRKRMIYLGDGVGDYCPSLNLREGDFVMPRKKFPVFDKICQNPLDLKAEIYEWTDGEEFEHILLKLINRITIEETTAAQFITTDFKLETLSVSGHEVFHKALPVLQ